MSLERIQSLWFNRRVKSKDRLSAIPDSTRAASNLISFADLRLPQPMSAETKVLIEYEDHPGGRSLHEVLLTCTAHGVDGLLYFGGYAGEKFSVFRADHIHRVTAL